MGHSALPPAGGDAEGRGGRSYRLAVVVRLPLSRCAAGHPQGEQWNQIAVPGVLHRGGPLTPGGLLSPRPPADAHPNRVGAPAARLPSKPLRAPRPCRGRGARTPQRQPSFPVSHCSPRGGAAHAPTHSPPCGGRCRSLPLRRQGAEGGGLAIWPRWPWRPLSPSVAARQLPLGRPARNLHFPSPPARRGEMPQAEGGLRARPHQIAEAPHRHFVTPPPAGKLGAGGLTRRSPRGERFCRLATHPGGSASSACPRRDASAPAPPAPCPSPGRAAAAREAPACRAAG